MYNLKIGIAGWFAFIASVTAGPGPATATVAATNAGSQARTSEYTYSEGGGNTKTLNLVESASCSNFPPV